MNTSKFWYQEGGKQGRVSKEHISPKVIETSIYTVVYMDNQRYNCWMQYFTRQLNLEAI